MLRIGIAILCLFALAFDIEANGPVARQGRRDVRRAPRVIVSAPSYHRPVQSFHQRPVTVFRGDDCYQAPVATFRQPVRYQRPVTVFRGDDCYQAPVTTFRQPVRYQRPVTVIRQSCPVEEDIVEDEPCARQSFRDY